MKKTLFALLACAAVAQAASLSWSIGGVKYATEDGSTTNVTMGSYSAYLFVTSVTSGTVSGITTTTQSAILESLASAHEDGSNWVSMSQTLAQASASNSPNTGAGAWSAVPTGILDFSTGDSVTAFAVIFDATDIANANNYFVVEEKTVSFSNATTPKTLNFTTQSNSALPINSSNVSWQSIGSATTPEPATATLSLLALAGLASRRRRH